LALLTATSILNVYNTFIRSNSISVVLDLISVQAE
jgi:hypothetical protein